MPEADVLLAEYLVSNPRRNVRNTSYSWRRCRDGGVSNPRRNVRNSAFSAGSPGWYQVSNPRRNVRNVPQQAFLDLVFEGFKSQKER